MGCLTREGKLVKMSLVNFQKVLREEDWMFEYRLEVTKQNLLPSPPPEI